MNITIIGGGNIGTQFAVHCAAKGHVTTVYSSKPERFANEVSIVGEAGNVMLHGQVYATGEMQQACGNADLIFVTVPATMMEKTANQMLSYLKRGAKIGLIPGTGGGECAFYKALQKGCTVFGLQRVPSVARLVEYGKCVCATGYRSDLYLAALPHMETDACCNIIAEIFDMPCHGLPNYLNVTMTPSNPILHTTRLRSIFSDYCEGKTYEKIPLFYEEWDLPSAELLLKCDDEVQDICKALAPLDVSWVRSLREHYESDTPQALMKKLCSIKSLKGLKTPSVLRADGYAPDFNSRYFSADFPYGLNILLQIARFCGVDVPNISETWDWYRKWQPDAPAFSYSDSRIKDKESFLEFYKL